jgi:hypothetical protein
MTSPEPLRNFFSAYNPTEKELRALLLAAAAEANTLIPKLWEREGLGAKVRGAQLARVLKEIRTQQTQGVWANVKPVLTQGLDRSTKAAMKDAGKVINGYLRRNGLRLPGLEDSFAAQARNGFKHAISKGVLGIPLSQRVYKAQAWANGLVDRRVSVGLLLGQSAKEIARAVRDMIHPDVKGGVSYAAMRLARTELNNAFHTTAKQRMDEPWATGVRWHLSGSHPKSAKPEACELLALQTYDPGSVPNKPHPQCFPAGTVVSANDVRAATKRWYSGELVKVSFVTDGPQLTGTPNHPALTTRGWVPLGELRQGDRVVYNSSGHRPALIEPHNKKVPALIEEIATSLGEAGGVTALTVPGSSVQFHGDGAPGNVDIVCADSLLDYGSWEAFVEPGLAEPIVQLLALACLGGEALRLPGFGLTPHRRVRHSGSVQPLLRSLNRSGFASAAQWMACASEGTPYGTDANTCEPADFLKGLSGGVELHEISVTGRVDFSGHVYNLQTDNGWYEANGYIVHNCLCYITQDVVDENTFLDSLLNGQYDNYLAQQNIDRPEPVGPRKAAPFKKAAEPVKKLPRSSSRRQT